MAVAAPPVDEGLGAGLPPEAAAAFAALRARFLAGLPARWAEIRTAASEAECLSALHRLAGAAASYGFARLGALARQAEQAPAAEREAMLRELEALVHTPDDTVP